MAKWCGVVAAVAVLALAAAPVGVAGDASDVLSGVCTVQGGVWYPLGPVGAPECILDSNGFVLQPTRSSFVKTGLLAADIGCKHLDGYSGVVLGGKGLPTGDFFVAAWWCA